MADLKKDNRYYTLDFWRGVACLMIVAFHASFYFLENPKFGDTQGPARLFLRFLDHLWVGVPIFFVISGYCITAACENAGARKFRVLDYFKRRVRRIFPPYWVALVLFLAICGVALGLGAGNLLFDNIHANVRPAALSISQWLGNVSLTESWRHNLGGDRDRFFLGPAWSLCYEEQFYAICGILLWLSGRHFFRACFAISGIVAVMVASDWFSGNGKLNGFFFDGRWLEFACGVAVYYRVQYRQKHLGLRWLLDGLLLIAFLSSLVLWKAQKLLLQEELFVAAGFSLMAIFLFKYDRLILAGRQWRWVWLCGTMCYSLYLTHWPVVKCTSNLLYRMGVEGPWLTLLVTIPLCIAASMAVGWGFYRLVERRFLNTKPVEFERVFSPSGQRPSHSTNLDEPAPEAVPDTAGRKTFA